MLKIPTSYRAFSRTDRKKWFIKLLVSTFIDDARRQAAPTISHPFPQLQSQFYVRVDPFDIIDVLVCNTRTSLSAAFSSNLLAMTAVTREIESFAADDTPTARTLRKFVLNKFLLQTQLIVSPQVICLRGRNWIGTLGVRSLEGIYWMK